MVDKTINQAPGGEITTPDGTEQVPVRSGATDYWVKIQNWITRKLRETGGPTNLDMGAVADGEYLRRSGSAIVGNSALAGDLWNRLHNGGFDLAIRQVDPATYTTYAPNTYSADRWKTYAENADYQYRREDALSEGIASRYMGAFKKITNTGKMMIYQIIEGDETIFLRGRSVIFQLQMKASSTKTIRVGIFELQNAGTLDSVPSPIVTAAGANTVDPTMGANVALIGTASSFSVGTGWNLRSVTATIPSNSKNLIVAVWTDSQFAANDILYLAEAGLHFVTSTSAWKPRPMSLETLLCERFAVQPFDVTQGNIINAGLFRENTPNLIANIDFRVPMRAAPTLSHNITGWNNALTPGATELAAFNFAAGANVTITGALTVSVDEITTKHARLFLSAATSFSGSAGNVCDLRAGSQVKIILTADL